MNKVTQLYDLNAAGQIEKVWPVMFEATLIDPFSGQECAIAFGATEQEFTDKMADLLHRYPMVKQVRALNQKTADLIKRWHK